MRNIGLYLLTFWLINVFGQRSNGDTLFKTKTKNFYIYVNGGIEFRYRLQEKAKYCLCLVGGWSTDLILRNSTVPILNAGSIYRTKNNLFVKMGIGYRKIEYGVAYGYGDFSREGMEEYQTHIIQLNTGVSKLLNISGITPLVGIDILFPIYRGVDHYVVLSSYKEIQRTTMQSVFQISYPFNVNKTILMPQIHTLLFDFNGLKEKRIFRSEGVFYWWNIGLTILM